MDCRHLQIMQDEIHEDELFEHHVHDLDQEDAEIGLNNEHVPVNEQELQLGFVQLIQPSVDPVLEGLNSPKALPADYFRFWAKHFGPCGGPSATFVPPERATFLQLL